MSVRVAPNGVVLQAMSAIVLLAFTAPAVHGASIAGALTLVEKGKPVTDAAAAVIWFVPAGGAAKPVPVRAEIQTRDRRFIPRVTVVPAGSEVAFPNSDPILHNVFSVSPRNRFDLGLYRKGSGKSTKFSAAGLVRVYCNVHQAMVAYVLVVDTPHFTRPADDGGFSLENLPAGSGTLYIWHERAVMTTRQIELPLAQPLEMTLELQPAGPIVHLDKNGRPYRTDRRDDNYR